MTVDLELLRREADQLRKEWDAGLWAIAWRNVDADGPEPCANPGAVAERCIALIEYVRLLEAEHDCPADHARECRAHGGAK